MSANAEDMLKYRAAECKSRINAITDSLCAVLADVELDDATEDGFESLLRELHDLADENRAAAAMFGNPDVYSDGRMVESFAPITEGMSQGVIWHPDPSRQGDLSWTAPLPSFDPEQGSPGVYQVTLHPRTQQINVRVIRNDTTLVGLRRRLERLER